MKPHLVTLDALDAVNIKGGGNRNDLVAVSEGEVGRLGDDLGAWFERGHLRDRGRSRQVACADQTDPDADAACWHGRDLLREDRAGG